eukprot:gnl/Chilomastix_caulleri/1724.p1 GENE.gnl/Chilomastix_caulleri/1724~~gnl/Chilomastix_caulleri/1724.p1  ORF type:complete len:136 (+),score=56.94 gnl/Chilomastix_caulleri/1724:144-551(+)
MCEHCITNTERERRGLPPIALADDEDQPIRETTELECEEEDVEGVNLGEPGHEQQATAGTHSPSVELDGEVAAVEESPGGLSEQSDTMIESIRLADTQPPPTPTTTTTNINTNTTTDIEPGSETEDIPEEPEDIE